MKKSIKISFDQELQIFFKYYLGKITLEDIINSWDDIIKNNIMPKNSKGIIVDLTKGTIKMTLEELSYVSLYYQKNISTFRNKKIAYISDNPLKTVYSMLIEQKDIGYSTKTFSTTNGAIGWIIN